jgi:hypothetical protein
MAQMSERQFDSRMLAAGDRRWCVNNQLGTPPLNLAE